ncbi:MAG: PGF-pre-PGF domain-containing protein, partial [Euryarchaeota archaeon]|nr:PGF-pre-PGF domain-containing protein [Euryarchaeota archaeon]
MTPGTNPQISQITLIIICGFVVATGGALAQSQSAPSEPVAFSGYVVEQGNGSGINGAVLYIRNNTTSVVSPLILTANVPPRGDGVWSQSLWTFMNYQNGDILHVNATADGRTSGVNVTVVNSTPDIQVSNFTFDTQPPVGSGQGPNGSVCLPSATVSVDVTDAGAGVNQSSIRVAVQGTNVTSQCPLTAVSGGHRYSCALTFPAAGSVSASLEASDTLGHAMSPYNWSFTLSDCPTPTPTPVPAGGGGGGGGGNLPPAQVVSHAESTQSQEAREVKPGAPVVLSFPRGEVSRVTIETSAGAALVQVTVSSLRGLPSSVPTSAPGRVLRYLSIEAKGLDAGSIRGAEVEVQVPRSWLEDQRLDPGRVQVQRYTGRWEPLETRRVGEDATHIRYAARTPGFSIFAITGLPAEATPSPTPTPP